MSKKEYVSWFVWVGSQPSHEAKYGTHVLAESREEAIRKSGIVETSRRAGFKGNVHARKSNARTR